MAAADNERLIRRLGESGAKATEGQPGMAEMSKRFHDEGAELYLPAAE